MKGARVWLVCMVLVLLIGCASTAKKDNKILETNLEKYLFHIKQGNEKIQNKQYKEAIDDLRAASQYNPHAVEIYNLIGICYMQLKLYNLAGEEFIQAIGRNPVFAAAHNNLGTIYYVQANYEEAIREFKEALRLNPQMAAAYHNLANIYLKQNKIDWAIEFYKHAFRINPEYAAPSSTFLTSVDEFPKGKGEKEYSYACVLASLGEDEKALEFLQKAIDMGFSDWEKIKSEEDLEHLRDNPLFQKLIKEE
jgi:tetratricopeptide (TPR) repeat protein